METHTCFCCKYPNALFNFVKEVHVPSTVQLVDAFWCSVLAGFSFLSTLVEWNRIGDQLQAAAARGFPSWDFCWYRFNFGTSFSRQRHCLHQVVSVCHLIFDTLSGGGEGNTADGQLPIGPVNWVHKECSDITSCSRSNNAASSAVLQSSFSQDEALITSEEGRQIVCKLQRMCKKRCLVTRIEKNTKGNMCVVLPERPWGNLVVGRWAGTFSQWFLYLGKKVMK